MRAPLESGWEALDGGDWETAQRCFAAAVAAGSDHPAAFEGLGWAAWWLSDETTVFAARRRAFHLYREQQDDVSAARMALWLASDHHEFRGEHAVASGWYQRAHRLLADVPVCPEHGWLAFQEGAYALELEDDTATALERAAEAAAVGGRLRHADLQFLGLSLEGLALVTEGDVDEGMRRLDEVGVAATSGELKDRIATAWSLCYLIYACERVRDFGRAAQWCSQMEEVSAQFVFELGMGVCRAHYGGVLVLHGDWSQAEQELTAAGEILTRTRPLAAVEADVRLAELRRRQGHVDRAREVFARSAPHPAAVVGLARLAFDVGDAKRAAEMLDDLLDMTPVASLTQRAEALELLAQVRAALGDQDATRAAAASLGTIAKAVRTKPMQAMAATAEAALANVTGDPPGERRRLEEAIELFERSGLPYEAEVARIDLASVLSRLQRAEAAGDHARQAAHRLHALGARDAAQRAERAASVESRGVPSPLAGLTPREIEVLALLTEGLSDRQVGERLHISAHTAHRHISNILSKLGVSTRAAAAAVAGRHGIGRPPHPT